MAQSPRYVRPRLRPRPRPRPVPAAVASPARLSPGLIAALWVSAMVALSTCLLLVRSWVLDAPAADSETMLILGVGGITWLTSLGYYALWQLDKQNGAPTRPSSHQDRED